MLTIIYILVDLVLHKLAILWVLYFVSFFKIIYYIKVSGIPSGNKNDMISSHVKISFFEE